MNRLTGRGDGAILYTWTPDGSTLLILDSHGLTRLQRPTKRGGAWKIKTDPKRRGTLRGTDQAGARLLVGGGASVLGLPSLKKVAEPGGWREIGLSPDGEVLLHKEYGLIRLRGLDDADRGGFPIPGGETLGVYDAALDSDGCGALWAGGDLWLFDVQDAPTRAIIWVDQIPVPERDCQGCMAGGQLLLWKEAGSGADARIRWWRIGRDGDVSAQGEEQGAGFTAEGSRIAWQQGGWAIIRDLRDGREQRVSLLGGPDAKARAGAGAEEIEGRLILGPQELLWLPWPGIFLEEPQSGQRWERGEAAHLPLWEGLRAVQRRYNAAGAEVGARWDLQLEVKDQQYRLRWVFSGTPPTEAEDPAGALSAELIGASSGGCLDAEGLATVAGFSYASYEGAVNVPKTTGPITGEMVRAAVDRFRRHGCNWLSTQSFWAGCADAWGGHSRSHQTADRVEAGALQALLEAQLIGLAGEAEGAAMAAMTPGELADALAAIFDRIRDLGHRSGKVIGWLVARIHGEAALPFFQRMLINGDAERYGLGWGSGTLGSDLFGSGNKLIKAHPHLRAELEAWGQGQKFNPTQDWIFSGRLLAA